MLCAEKIHTRDLTFTLKSPDEVNEIGLNLNNQTVPTVLTLNVLHKSSDPKLLKASKPVITLS